MTALIRAGLIACAVGLALLAVQWFAAPLHAAEAGYCSDWREFVRSAASSETSEFWSFALAKYCDADGEPAPVLTTAALVARVDDWAARCAAEYRTWDAATGTVIRRVSHGARVPCPLPR